MSRDWRWLVGLSAALLIAALCAGAYTRAAMPYYTLVARWMAAKQPWTILGMDVSRQPHRGAILRMVGTVREHNDDPLPAARLVAKLPVATVVESPLIFWSVLLLWPCANRRQRLLVPLTGVPLFLGLEAATTVCQLLNPLAYASAVLAGDSEPITLWERWSRFLEGGGRVALALVAALCAIALARTLEALGRHRREVGEGVPDPACHQDIQHEV